MKLDTIGKNIRSSDLRGNYAKKIWLRKQI